MLGNLLKTPSCGRLKVFWQCSIFVVVLFFLFFLLRRFIAIQNICSSLLVTDFADNLYNTNNVYIARMSYGIDTYVRKPEILFFHLLCYLMLYRKNVVTVGRCGIFPAPSSL